MAESTVDVSGDERAPESGVAALADHDPETLARALGEALAATPEHEAVVEAERRVAEDEEAQELIQAFERQRESFIAARDRGDATRDDLQALEEAQRRVESVESVAELNEAREALGERLEAANDAVSEPLAVEFAGEASGCCQE